MSGSLGWLTESTILPKKPTQIEQVGKASMVDLHAALYATEAARSSSNGSSLQTAEQKRGHTARSSSRVQAGSLGIKANPGVLARSAKDKAAEAKDEEHRQLSLKRKADTYDQMQRGEDVATKAVEHSLVDFELKNLMTSGSSDAVSASSVAEVPRSGPPADDREAARLEWERRARDEIEVDARRGTLGNTRGEDCGSSGAQRLAEHRATEAETQAQRDASAELRSKRQRALDERRAQIRQKQQARRHPALVSVPSVEQELAGGLTPTSALGACASSPLPLGWGEAIDPSSGRPYYFLVATGQPQWTRPLASAPPPPPSSPPPLPPPQRSPQPTSLPSRPQDDWPAWQQQMAQRRYRAQGDDVSQASDVLPVAVLSHEEAIRASMGLPTGFTSAVHEQNKRDLEEAHASESRLRGTRQCSFAPPPCYQRRC